MTHQPKILTIILDGWGINKDYPGNAITQANTSYYDSLLKTYPNIPLECSGLAVGLPEGQMGTSEVNHMTIGAGRIIYQDLVKINKAIKDGYFFQNEALLLAINHAKKHNSTLHIKGLYSPGGVHSHSDHFKALVKLVKQHQLENQTVFHLITDGRDTKPQSALEYVQDFVEFLQAEQVGHIASLSGRYWAMDRDHNWDRTDKYFKMLVEGEAQTSEPDALSAIKNSYQNGINDEFIEPTIIGTQPSTIKTNDSVIFVNFRSDRPRQLVERFTEKGPTNLCYVTIAQYNPQYPVQVAFPPESTANTLGEVISKAGLKQLRITETEKFAHLTFFMNCKKEEPFPGEERIMLESNSDIREHSEKPEMRTPDIAKRVIDEINHDKFAAIFVNLCNADMVGHTGDIPATIRGVEAVDQALAQVVPAALNKGYSVIITADHGNAEQMLDETKGDKLTAHTSYPVPFILISERFSKLSKKQGQMADIAPTILTMMGLEIPEEMRGERMV